MGQAVNIGTPPIWNYSRKIYGAATQNWDATQDNEKIMYWANNNGLLRHDGSSWLSYPVSNHTIVRSIAFDGDERIYAGAQSELGYFSPDALGQLKYTSLVGLLAPDHRHFEDVWDIVFFEEKAFFRTNKYVFEYDGQQIRAYDFGKPLDALYATSGALILQQESKNLLKYSNGTFNEWITANELSTGITGMIPWLHDTVIISTLKQGLFFILGDRIDRWTTPYDHLLIEKRIYSSTLLKDGNIAIGTSLDGLIVLNKNRQVYRHLNKQDGLQNNNILSAYCDKEGNLWLGLDNGIDCVVLDSRFTTIYPDDELQATAYAAAVFDNHLYLGVSNGAYIAPWQSYYDPEHHSYFERIENGEGQVWGFSVIDHSLLMGHHEGAFIINQHTAKRIFNEPGTWTYVKLNDDYLLAGTYEGLVLYKRTNDEWVYDGKLKGINESCRIMVKDDDGAIWVSHPYRGLYKVDWTSEKKYNPVVTFYDQSSGLPSNLNNYVFQVSGKAVFGTERGVYDFDTKSNRFVGDQSFNEKIGATYRIKCLKEDLKGNVWYVTDKEVGILLVDEHGLKKDVTKKIFPELHGKLVGGFELIYPIDEHNVLFGAEEGFILYNNHPRIETDTTLRMVFNGVRINRTQDSLLFGGYDHASELNGPQTLQASLNNLSFSFSATEYKSPYLIQYHTRLEGLEEEWTAWSTETKRDFTNLGPGHYTFYAQARINDGKESNTIAYSFYIRPPWYKTKPAYGLYGFAFLSMFAGLIIRQRKKFETEKTQMTLTHREKEAQHLREVEQSKAALSEIQNEKLEVEIKYKNQELAMTTLHLVQKAEILLNVQEALNQIREKNKDAIVNKEIKSLLNLLNFDVKLDEDWEHFAHHFDQVHVDFLKQLRDQFPQLSASDFKLCAYLRMNLSTKEIAPLLNISIRGVEGSRYRLRRKLNLPNDANLTEFILSLPAGNHNGTVKKDQFIPT
ncbi:MAG: triple tyrosine motif-containing protein [Saprospiraceae bacterium]